MSDLHSSAQITRELKLATDAVALDYGASTSSADNTAAVQQAIDACQKVGGGIVEIPAGAFRFRGTLRLTANRVWLRGVGRGATTMVFFSGSYRWTEATWITCLSLTKL